MTVAHFNGALAGAAMGLLSAFLLLLARPAVSFMLSREPWRKGALVAAASAAVWLMYLGCLVAAVAFFAVESMSQASSAAGFVATLLPMAALALRSQIKNRHLTGTKK